MTSGLKMVRTWSVAGLSLAGALLATQARAQTNLVSNGGFESTNLTASNDITDPYGGGSHVTGWTSTGTGFVFFPSATSISGTTADTTGATQPENYSNQAYLWGPGNGATSDGTAGSNAASNGTEGANSGNPTVTGVANGLTVSANGGNFLALDGDSSHRASVSQTVTGLQGGGVYKLTFYWAAAEQEGPNYSAATTEQFSVGFGNTTTTTNVIDNVSKGFSGWQQATMFFEAGSASQVLSFLAIGTPNGVPPFALLDGVSLVLAPEPTSWAVMMVGLAGMGLMMWRRRSAAGRSGSLAS